VGKDHKVSLWDYKNQEVLDQDYPDDYINIKQSPETIWWGAYSQHIVVGSANGMILVYNLANKNKAKPKKFGQEMRSYSLRSKDDLNSVGSWKLKLIKTIDTTQDR